MSSRGYRWVVRMAAVFVALLAVQCCVLLFLVFRPGGTANTGPAPGATTGHAVHAAGGQRGSPGALEGGGAGGGPMASYLDETAAVLAEVAVEFNMEPSRVAPSAAAIEAAVREGSESSDAYQAVMQQLRAGYALFHMPFPEPHGKGRTLGEPQPPPTGQGTRPASPASPASPANPEPPVVHESDPPAPDPGSDAGPSSQDAAMVGAYFRVVPERLSRKLAATPGADPGLMPEAAMLAEASASGSFDSPSSQQALERLEAAYEALGLVLPAPVVSP